MDLRERLLSKREIDPVTGCWNWTASLTVWGYGQIKIRPRNMRVNRVAAHVFKGFDLNSKLWVLHRCDNRRCFNPDHLFYGTAKDNQQDCIAKGRHSEQQRTHCPQGHAYSGKNLRISCRGARLCKACDLIRQKAKRDEMIAKGLSSKSGLPRKRKVFRQARLGPNGTPPVV